MVSKEAEKYWQSLCENVGTAINEFSKYSLMEAFDAGVESEKKHRWQDVKKELPKENKEYLVSYDENCKNSFYVLHYDTSNKCWYEEGSELSVSKPYWWKEIVYEIV